MLGISSFLQKFIKLDQSRKLEISQILESIKNISGIELQEKQVQIKGGRLQLSCSPVFRNEIFLRQSQIEDSLKLKNIFLRIY